jgi:hypothetical protein
MGTSENHRGYTEQYTTSIHSYYKKANKESEVDYLSVRYNYETLYSCAGHKDTLDYRGKVKPDNSGYVTIQGNQNINGIKQISKKYVKGIKIKRGRLMNPTRKTKTISVTDVSFKPKNLSKWGGD